MSAVTMEQVEQLLQQLPEKQQVSVFARLIQHSKVDDELLEDLEDILHLRRHRHEDDETIPWEQVKEEMRGKGLL